MRFRIKRNWQDESNTWIAYTDFLTTVLTLFVIIAIMSISEIRKLEADSGISGSAVLYGMVIDKDSMRLLPGCTVTINSSKEVTNEEGKFVTSGIDISKGSDVQVVIEAKGYRTYDAKISLKKGRNDKTFGIILAEQGGDGDVIVKELPGDAFFKTASAELHPQAIETLKKLGREFKAELKPDEVVVIQGYTDDQPYGNDAKSNWELSGERAAAVCRIFQDKKHGVGIFGEQIILMGYNEFVPKEKILAGDSPAVIDRKRAQNRRIRIVKLKGAHVLSTGSR